ncbi:hypothetical protein I3843_09G220000 [Carya illinoinensis]|nr:hypothetical protein I3843_09G220000 [Carya illinoinensis]
MVGLYSTLGLNVFFFSLVAQVLLFIYGQPYGVFANSPFFISAEVAGALDARKSDEYKEISVLAGKTYEVSLTVDSINSYIAWDFSLVQGKMNMDIGFTVEFTNFSGEKTLILPSRRYESDQGNFCACMVGNYKLIWDNSYSTFFKKVLRYKVDCIPPVAEPVQSVTEVEGREDPSLDVA